MSHQQRDEDFTNLVRLDFFADIGKAIATPSTLKGILDAVMEHVAQIFAPSNWSVLLRKHPSGELVFVKVTGGGVSLLEGKVLPKGSGIAGWIAENGLPLVIPDVSKDTRFDPSMDASSGFVTKSIIGVPLKTQKRVFGVIELVNRLDGSSFSAYDLKLLTTIADFAAIALEKVYYMQHLKRAAITDPLTKLNNRRLLNQVIQREISILTREGRPFSLLFIDINDFKTINDTLGHDGGDEVLKTVAQILKSATRKSDFACRFGGDEFVLVLAGLNETSAGKIRDRILADPRLKAPLEFGLSIGIKEGTEGSAEEILKAVDLEMYFEKVESSTADPEVLSEAYEDLMGEK